MAEGPTPVDPAERSPEQLRRDIEATRADMSGTLVDIEDRASPRRIRERQTRRVKGKWSSMREAVMGRTDDAMESSRQTGAQARERLSDAPEKARRRTQGNPLAAGLIAFGGGLLAAAVLPSTQQEQDAAEQLRDRYQEPAKQKLQEAGQQAREDLQPRAQQAAEEVKQTAQQGAQQTRDEAQRSAQDVKGHAQSARQDVQQ